MKPLNILYWFRRRPREKGGDLVALEATMDALRAFDVRGDVSQDPEIDLAPYDLIHFYNLCDPYSATDYIVRAAKARKPVVVSPIYWSHAQYDAACQTETPQARPELFLGAETPQEQDFFRAKRRRVTATLHDGQALALDAAAKILVISQGEGKILVDEFGVPESKLKLTYYGVEPKYLKGDADRFEREFGVRDFVYCAARFEERKNHVGIVRAWRNETVPLVLAGPVPDQRYFDLCRKEASPNVHFVGALTPQQIADCAAAARVHVLASWWEEMGLAAMEAGVAGCNLVMTQNGPGREYFGEDCISVDPANASEIHAAIQAALKRPRATHLAKYINEKFTWEASARATREAYDEVLEAQTLPTINPEKLMQMTRRMAAEIDAETVNQWRYQDLEHWAHEMERRLKQPPSVRNALRAQYERLVK